METLNNLIQTVGLNHSFFYQLLIAILLFFISRKWLWNPYIASMDERDRLTKGRLSNTKELDLKIQANQELYEKKAKQLHKDFQAVFNDRKELALQDFLKKSLQLEKEYKESLKKKRRDLKAAVKTQESLLKKELPDLSALLLNKIKS